MNSYIVSPSPHIRSGRTTRKIMLDVIIALCPGIIASAVIFGWRVLLVTAVCVGSCVLIEYLCRLVMKRDQTIGDLSAVVTGMLLAMNLPVSIPLWAAMIGSFFAIAMAKQLFGGIGQNFANPALTARILLLMSFSGMMTEKSVPLGYEAVDAVASATPLVRMAAGGVCGGVCGRWVNRRISERAVDRLFIALMVLMLALNAKNLVAYMR